MRSNDQVSKPVTRTSASRSSASSTECPRLSMPAYRGSKVWIPSDRRVTPSSRHDASMSASTVPGFASSVVSVAGGRMRIRRASTSRGSNEGVPPPKYTLPGAPSKDDRQSARSRAIPSA